MARARFSCPDGLSIGELRNILADCPTENLDGEEEVIYVLSGNGHISPLIEVIIDDDNSTILVPEFHADVMHELDTYYDFFGFEPEEGVDDEDDVEDEDDDQIAIGLN